MKTYYLQTLPSNESVIHYEMVPGATLDSQVEAESWIKAKESFGFELTDIQYLLSEGEITPWFAKQIIHEQMPKPKVAR